MKRIGCALIFLLALPAISALADDATPDRQVVEWVFQTWQLDRDDYEIEVLSDFLEDLSEGTRIEIDRPLSQKEPLGLFTLLVDIHAEDEPPRSAQVRLRVRSFADVLVSADRLSSRDIIDEDSFVLERVDITDLREQPVTSMDDVLGYRLTRNLRRGAVLTMRAVEPFPDMEQNASVTIVFTAGLCTVTARGQSLQDGYIGETVRVKNEASGKIIRAEVADSHTVILEH
jgi:flagella basal body P-ring formation protein FlgA